MIGAKNITLEIGAPSKLGLVIDLVSQKFSPKFKEELLDKEGSLDRSYSIFINGVQSRSLSDIIKDGDELVLLTAMGGG